MKEKIKTWIFNIRMKRAVTHAVTHADKLANQLRCKVIILNINGKPVITTMQRIRAHQAKDHQRHIRLLPRQSALHHHATKKSNNKHECETIRKRTRCTPDANRTAHAPSAAGHRRTYGKRPLPAELPQRGLPEQGTAKMAPHVLIDFT